jgi:hypothetical protein
MQDTADQDFWEFGVNASVHEKNGKGKGPIIPVASSAARQIFEFCVLTDANTLMEHKGPVHGLSIEQAINFQGSLTQILSFSVAEQAFCITAAGAMAFVPPLSEAGDKLAHIRGGYMPGVLRAKQSGPRMAEWVGPCSVHKIDDVYSGLDWENWLIV